MPALARVRQLAFRLTCGTNLSGIGKAMLIYANDYEDELPRAGGKDAQWGAVTWNALDRVGAYGLGGDRGGAQGTISSCFYLLVKYAEVTPKSFICKGDTGTAEWSLAEETAVPTNFELIDAWDFGATPWDNCSYSYHIPFTKYALTTASEPGLAVAADRNPWLASPAGDPVEQNWTDFRPDTSLYNGTTESALMGNAIAHQGDGQNVLFLDGHVNFEKRAFCSLEDDNIYTISDSAVGLGSSFGARPVIGRVAVEPRNRKDSLLVHDPSKFGTGR
jgi:prepilin-type processing-associated H-X9-DG protein